MNIFESFLLKIKRNDCICKKIIEETEERFFFKNKITQLNNSFWVLTNE